MNNQSQALFCLLRTVDPVRSGFYPGSGVPDNARMVYSEMISLFSSSCLFASISSKTASTAKVVEAVFFGGDDAD